MKTVNLEGKERIALGKKETKKSRKEQQIPCVLYGNGIENRHFTIFENELKPVIYTPEAYLLNLNISGKIYTAVLRDIQFHPVSDKILHVDFFNIDANKPVIIDLPITIEGNSEGVKQGGKLQILARKLKVSALINNLPEHLAVDITELGMGKTIFVKDLSYPDITILTPQSAGVCRVKATRASREAAAQGK
ncbi:MAG: 50S ribosomal protein L25/general stress protein Ctc [Prevotellaceae bacterium]|jgi:large subunit ribosomal protein L25|nr:50S ribosomal protein L25/general stress protein Ctc [Prevotellaceae bacterium]